MTKESEAEGLDNQRAIEAMMPVRNSTPGRAKPLGKYDDIEYAVAAEEEGRRRRLKLKG